MNPFRADRMWRWPQFVHEVIWRVSGKVVIRTGTWKDDIDNSYRWGDYYRDVFWPTQERFLASLRAKRIDGEPLDDFENVYLARQQEAAGK